MEDTLNRNPGAAGFKPRSPWAARLFKTVLALGSLLLLIALCLPAIRFSREAGRRAGCLNNIHNIGLALQHYAADHGGLPPAYTVDAQGKRLHSWRTLILPYLEQHDLYKSIDLSKPWDDPVNAKALATTVKGYQCPTLEKLDNRTTYMAVVGPNCCMLPERSRPRSELSDGGAKTLMLIEVDREHRVPWMSPMDADDATVLSLGPESKLAHPGGVNVAFADGHASFFFYDTSAAERRAMIFVASEEDVAGSISP